MFIYYFFKNYAAFFINISKHIKLLDVIMTTITEFATDNEFQFQKEQINTRNN